MGDSRGASGFGSVDELSLDEHSAVHGTPTARPPAPVGTGVGESSGFGELDWDLGEDEKPAEEKPPPASTSRVGTTAAHTRATRQNMAAQTAPNAGAEATRPPPASHDDNNTRAWAEIDEQLMSVARGESDAPASSRSGHQPAPSGSGVATRDNRVAAMRELYAKGDADGALALAATLGQSIAPSSDDGDHPGASVVVEFGEQSVDLEDPFGGLVPEDDDLAATPTAAPPPPAMALTVSPPPACAAPQLSLTERHSIPRLLKSMAEVSKLKIDHRAGFLLAHVDGMHTLEEILDICAMPSAEALELIANLRETGVIEFE